MCMCQIVYVWRFYFYQHKVLFNVYWEVHVKPSEKIYFYFCLKTSPFLHFTP